MGLKCFSVCFWILFDYFSVEILEKKANEIQFDFTDQWTTELTMYGRCKSFVDDHGTSDVDDGISDATFRTLQLVLAYNTSDWTYGWSYYMDGFSIFYSPKGEVVLDHMVS